MALDRATAARLARRTGLGATAAEVGAAEREGADAYVRRIIAADPTDDPGAAKTPVPTFEAVRTPGKDAGADAKKAHQKALRAQGKTLTLWWLRRMLAVEEPFREKATFVWHSHFATSLQKVRDARMMLQHNERQRGLATGSFSTLAFTMLTDGATQRWLDNVKNTVDGPNENLSREFMEIYTLGHADGYTEQDVREGARALTGYKIDAKDGDVTLRAKLHDPRPKTIFGKTADWDAKSFCDAVLDRPGCSPYIVTRLYNRYVSNAAPDAGTLRRLTGAYGPDRNLAALLTAMFTDESFAAAEGSFVIGPVEWLVGAMRALRTPAETDAQLTAARTTLDSLGQLPLYPPSVGGWPSGPVWLSTAAAELRFRAAARLTQHADLDALTGSTTAKLEALAELLGVASWSSPTLAVLKGSAGDVRRLAAVAINTPEYLVH